MPTLEDSTQTILTLRKAASLLFAEISEASGMIRLQKSTGSTGLNKSRTRSFLLTETTRILICLIRSRSQSGTEEKSMQSGEICHLIRGLVFDIEGVRSFTFDGARSNDIRDGILSPDDYNIKDKIKELGKAFIPRCS